MEISPSPEMEGSVTCVEQIIGYSFNNKRLVEEALTHSCSSSADTVSYQRLEFVGDAAIGLAISDYFFHTYLQLKPGQLTSLRAANVSTEKLARVAVRRGLYDHVRRFNVETLDDQILKGLLEPIITIEDLEKYPQPIRKLYELCQKQRKQIEIKQRIEGSKIVASVYIDDCFVASGSSDQKHIARLNAAKSALSELPQTRPVDVAAGVNGIEPKQKLHEVCQKNSWAKPIYNTEKELGPPHAKIFECSVEVTIVDNNKISITGNARSRVKDAESSAACKMIRAMQETEHAHLFS